MLHCRAVLLRDITHFGIQKAMGGGERGGGKCCLLLRSSALTLTVRGPCWRGHTELVKNITL